MSFDVDVCLDSVDQDAREALEDSDLDVNEYGCLQRCGDCYDGPFLVIDGRMVSCESHEVLLTKLESVTERSQ